MRQLYAAGSADSAWLPNYSNEGASIMCVDVQVEVVT